MVVIEKKIDIIIPCYKLLEHNISNFSELIDRLISGSNGDYISNIIIINDYPQEYIDSFVQGLFNDRKVSEKLILIQNKANLGQAMSRNIGALQSSSEYLHFIDQDDFIQDNFYKNLLEKKTDICLGTLFTYRNGTLIKKHHKIWTDSLYMKAKTVSDLSFFMMSNIAVSPGQYIIRKEVFDSTGGFPNLKNKGSDDYGLLFKMCMKNYSFSYTSKAIFYHRLHESQGKNNLNIDKSVKEFLLKVENVNRFSLLAIIKSIRLSAIYRLVIGKLFYHMFFNVNR